MEKTYTSEVRLPSNGQIAGIPKFVKVKPLTFRDEAILLGSNMSNKLDTVLAKLTTTVDDKSIDFSKMLGMDKTTILLEIRKLTYGPKYLALVMCPTCGEKHSNELDMEKFETTYLPEGFADKLQVALPQSKGKAVIRLLPEAELKDAVKYCEDKAKGDQDELAELLYVELIVRQIEALYVGDFEWIKGKGTLTSLRERVEELPAADVGIINNILDDARVGVQAHVIDECSHCKAEVALGVGMDREFFRSRD